MFVDKVRVMVQAGDGGSGVISFRQEKFVDHGGPDGGDGGKGGNIIFVASNNQNTLAAFRHQKELKAELGGAGSKQKKHGKDGADLVVDVPVGTIAIDESGATIADLTSDGQQVIIAKGGLGGFGNAHFISSRRQAPRIAENGEKGDKMDLTLELKMIANVGLIGLPNAGKSTLLKSTSNAKPEIANYPFTTLRPNLGVVEIDKTTSLLFADIPGLIEGASQGKGLGDEFLRHVERTSVLLHLIDIYENVTKAYRTIQKELKNYKIDLSSRPQIVVLNKIDGFDETDVNAKLKELKTVIPPKTPLYAISATSKLGVNDLLYEVKKIVAKTQKTAKVKPIKDLPILRLPSNDDAWQVERIDNRFVVTGKKIERFAERTDMKSVQGVQRLRDIMRKMGIMHELVRKGIQSGQKITIGKKSEYHIEF